MATETLSESLANHLATLRWDSLPARVRQAAILHVLDSVGVMLAGSRLEAGRLAYALAASLGSAPQVALPGTAQRLPLLLAVLASCTATHSGEMDDIHSGAATCVGGMIVPTLLALAEKFGPERGAAGNFSGEGRTFLEAAVAGYETTVRVGLAIDGPRLFERGWWPSSVCGVFGVAAAAARLLGLSIEQTVSALGIAGLQAGGMLSGGAEGPTARHLTFGRAAQSGVLAVLATLQGEAGQRETERGLTAPRSIFEGPRGFCRTLCTEPRWEFLRPQPGDYVLPDTAFKPYPCARQLHAAVEALLTLLSRHEISPPSIEAIDLGVPSAVAAMLDRPLAPGDEAPGNISALLGSGQYVMAVTALRGKLDLASFEATHTGNPDVLSLMRKVRVRADTDLDPHFPKTWPGTVRIRLVAGEHFERQVLVPKGETENPMSAAEVEEKFLTLTIPVIGAEQAARLLSKLRRLDQAPSLQPVFSLLGGPVA